MSIIDQIRALIKAQIRREELNFASLGGGGQTMNIGALEWVLKQLDTLQEQPVCRYDGITPDAEKCKGCTLPCEERPKEQPVCEDVEKEYEQFCKDYPFPWDSQYINREYIDELCLGVARHFYELGQQSKPKVSKELEEYASQAGFDYVDDIVLQAEPNHRWNDHDVENAHRDGIIKGASWQKEQIIKRATTAIKERWYDKFDTTLLGGLIQLGMDKQKEQMMKEAVEGHYDKEYGHLLCPWDFRAKLVDGQKVLIIKEG